jgi:hypothetical protein
LRNQGVWDFRNLIPFERPARFSTKEFLTEQGVTEFMKVALERLDMDRRDDDPALRQGVVNGDPDTADVNRAHNAFGGTPTVQVVRRFTWFFWDDVDAGSPDTLVRADAVILMD